jgi:hypothetical protein
MRPCFQYTQRRRPSGERGSGQSSEETTHTEAYSTHAAHTHSKEQHTTSLLPSSRPTLTAPSLSLSLSRLLPRRRAAVRSRDLSVVELQEWLQAQTPILELNSKIGCNNQRQCCSVDFGMFANMQAILLWMKCGRIPGLLNVVQREGTWPVNVAHVLLNGHFRVVVSKNKDNDPKNPISQKPK